MQCKTWFKKSFLSTIALIFILMIVADFSTFAIYVDVKIKKLLVYIMRFVCPCP